MVEKRLGSAALFDNRARGLGGWELDIHHRYDMDGRILYLGNGTRRRADKLRNNKLSTITSVTGNSDQLGLSGLSIAADGTIYVTYQCRHQILRIDPEGNTTVLAGNGVSNWPFNNSAVDQHELQHTLQGELIGPLYLPSNITGAFRV